MKKYILIFSSFLFLVIFAGCTNQDIQENLSNPYIQNNDEVYEVTHYLVPVTKFTNTKTNYSIEEMNNQGIFIDSKYKNMVPEEIDLNINFEEDLNIEKKLVLNGIVLLPPEQVKPWYKTISVDNNYFWHANLEDYPIFRVEEIRESDLSGVSLEILKKLDFDENDIKSIFSSGEIIPARAVDRLSLNKYNNYTFLFDTYRNDIESADLAITMIENSILGDPQPCTGCMLFRGDDKVAAGLAKLGFDLISTAGNHAGDAGQEAFLNTIDLFNKAGIQTTGTGKYEDLLKPITAEFGNMKVGMIAADDIAFYYWINENSNAYGTNNFSKYENGRLVIDPERIELINQIKEEKDIDYLIVYMSWGVEYTNKATNHQKELGRLLVDNGVDLVIGSHPHWVQNIEFYNDKLIIYSLGNFLFDQTHTLPTRQGAATNLYYYRGELKSIEIMPHKICGYHQTKNDLSQKYLDGEIDLFDVYSIPEKDGCIYWMPRKLDESLETDKNDYKQILERIFEYTDIKY